MLVDNKKGKGGKKVEDGDTWMQVTSLTTLTNTIYHK
jgi:hypothetical protein